MNVLACVKRVPATAGRITLTAGDQAIDTRFLGFTVSPHEECAVEEAVRLVEAEGGSSTVLTLGPEESADQLREAMAVGIDRAIHLVTDGSEWSPMDTAAAIVDAIRAREAIDGPFDVIMFGNEAADTGDYQVGVRVAVALDRPIVTGVKSLEIQPDSIVARREAAAGGWEVYDVPRPTIVSVREGINLPRYPSVPGRLRARKKEIERIEPVREVEDPGDDPAARPGRAGECRRDPGRGPGRGTPGGRGASAPGVDRMILVLLEHDAGVPDRLSAEALAFGRSLAGETGEPLHAVTWGPDAAAAAGAPTLVESGVAVLHTLDDPRLSDHAPEATGKAIAQLIERDRPVAVIGTAAIARRRSWPTRPRGPDWRWPSVAPRSGPAIPGASPGSGGPAVCSRKRVSTARSDCSRWHRTRSSRRQATPAARVPRSRSSRSSRSSPIAISGSG